MFATEFLLLAGAHFLALLSPGPDFLLLLRNTLRHGRANGIGAALGIALANGMYIVLALCGFSLLQQSPAVLIAMKWLASVYLAWLGLMFILASRQAHQFSVGEHTSRDRRAGVMGGIAAGFVSAALNPKNGLFYFGLFTVMVGAGTGLGRKLLYGGWMFAVVFAWDATLACLLAQRRALRLLSRALPVIERIAGVLLMAAAAGLALARL